MAGMQLSPGQKRSGWSAYNQRIPQLKIGGNSKPLNRPDSNRIHTAKTSGKISHPTSGLSPTRPGCLVGELLVAGRVH